MRFSVEDAIASGLWVALGTLALLSASDYWSTRTFLATSEGVNHAHEVVEQLDHLLAEMTDRGRRVMDDIRKLVGEMDRAERTVLLDRGSTARTSARLTLVVLLVGDVIAFGLVGSSYVIAMRGLGERRRHVAQVEEGRRGAERQAAELAALARDRDEARRAAQEASRLKSAFLANMSHEIRTPMTALVGYAELLGGADLAPAERAECLATVRRNGEHLMAIVNDILDLSKIES